MSALALCHSIFNVVALLLQNRLVTEVAHATYPDIDVVSPTKSYMLLTLAAQNADGDSVETPMLAYYWK
jgi:hypothetical protein